MHPFMVEQNMHYLHEQRLREAEHARMVAAARRARRHGTPAATAAWRTRLRAAFIGPSRTLRSLADDAAAAESAADRPVPTGAAAGQPKRPAPLATDPVKHRAARTAPSALSSQWDGPPAERIEADAAGRR